MRDHGVTQVTKYKEVFPNNHPPGELEATILILRMVHRFPLFKKANPKLPESFREILKTLLAETCIVRFQKFKEITTPFDESDIEAVIGGITKLADMVADEIHVDFKHFQKSFAQELDIARLTTEILLKYFILTLEDTTEILSSQQAVNEASQGMLDLYRKVRALNNNYAKLVPGLSTSSSGAAFNVEGWFSPFIYKWLNQLTENTIKWVAAAVKSDQFNPHQDEEMEDPPHSESITDLFTVVYSELEFITDLEWSNQVQTAQFFQMFAKTLHAAIDHYCTLILEKDADTRTFYEQAQNLLSSKSVEKQNITIQVLEF